MNKETTAVRYKLREFQWFQMQTRVRQIIQQLLAPFSKRVFQTMSTISSLKSFTMQQAHKLQQLKKIVTDDPSSKQINIFKSIDKKQEELQTQITQLKNLVGETQKVIDKRLKIQDQRLEESRDIVLNNMKLKQRISEEIMEQNNSLKEFRQDTQTVMDDFSRSLNVIIKQHQDDTKALKEQIAKLDERIILLEDFEKDTFRRFEMNREEHVNFHKEIIHNQEEIKSIYKQISALNQNLSYTKKLTSYVKDLQERINKQDYQTQFLAPLVTQAQITQTLYQVFPNKLKKRLLIYDYYQYGKMNANILQSDPRKQGQKFNGVSVLQMVQKRTTKCIVDMKRKKLIQNGIDIDNLTYEMKQKYYKQVDLNQQYLEQQQDPKPTPGIQREQVTQMIQQMLKLSKNELTRQITTEFDDSRKYIVSLEQQLQHNLQMSNQLVDKISHEIETFKTDQRLLNTYYEDKIETIGDNNTLNNKQMVNVKENLLHFIKFCSLVNHLQIQDELDKQSISLFGIKQSFNDQPNLEMMEEVKPARVVDIKKQCFSCCGFPASTMAAFKMACLTYAPSPIVLESKQFRRQQILEMSTKLLQHLKGELYQTRPIPSIVSAFSSVQQTQRKHTTLPHQSEMSNIFLYNTTTMTKSNQNKDMKQGTDFKDFKDYRQKSKRIATANSNIRTSTRLSSSLRTTKKKGDSSLLTTIFTEQQKKHAFYLS